MSKLVTPSQAASSHRKGAERALRSSNSLLLSSQRPLQSSIYQHQLQSETVTSPSPPGRMAIVGPALPDDA